MEKGWNFGKRKEGERENLRRRKRREREGSTPIGSLSLEQPKVGYPDPHTQIDFEPK